MYIRIRSGKNTIDKIHSLLRTDQTFEDRYVNHDNKIINIKCFTIK